MKSIVYILIAVLIGGIFITAFSNFASNQKQIVKIQSVVRNPDSKLLNESCQIIKKRLNDYGLQNYDVSLIPDQSILKITLSKKTDINEVLPLLISNGKTEFYETYNRTDFIKLLEKGDQLFSMLNIASENSETDNIPAILGFCKPGTRSQVDSYINQHYVSKPGEGIRFIWSKDLNKNGDYYLYLLKHNAALDKHQIQKASVSKNNESNNLMISFNEDGALVWQNLSKSNINKSIAIVVDNKVYYAPVLKNEIKDGKCSISGNFSTNELALLKSLINNEDLPTDFKIVK